MLPDLDLRSTLSNGFLTTPFPSASHYKEDRQPEKWALPEDDQRLSPSNGFSTIRFSTTSHQASRKKTALPEDNQCHSWTVIRKSSVQTPR